jgi:hypothetical protein
VTRVGTMGTARAAKLRQTANLSLRVLASS